MASFHFKIYINTFLLHQSFNYETDGIMKNKNYFIDLSTYLTLKLAVFCCDP